MKKYQHIFTLTAVTLLLVPQLAFAAWWNPFTWDFLSFLFGTEPKAEIIVAPANSATGHSSWESSLQESSTATTSVTTEPPKPDASAPAKTSSGKPSPALPSVTQRPQQAAQSTGTLCNGTYWDACPIGQNFVCPVTGDAHCVVPQVDTVPTPKNGSDQSCKDAHGGHSIWDGQTSSCACESGYLLSVADGNSCVSTYRYCNKSYGSHALWDNTSSSCACESGYEPSSNGKSCLKIQNSQTDLSIDSSACKTATDNLEKLQNDYSSGMTARMGMDLQALQGLQADMTDQYNAKFPVYQLAARVACIIPASNTKCQTALQNLASSGAPFSGGAPRNSWLSIMSYGTEIQFSCLY